MIVAGVKAFIEARGTKVYDTPEGLVVYSTHVALIKMADGKYIVDVYEEAHVFPIHFEPSRKDGFAEAHVDGREVCSWLRGH